MAEIPVVPAGKDQLAAISALIEPFVRARMLLPRTDDELASMIPRTFVALAGDRIVGCAAVEIYSKKLAEILCLAVHEDYQGRGVGANLVQACVELARREGVDELMAITWSESLFQRCGFDYSLPDQKRAMFIPLGNRELP